MKPFELSCEIPEGGESRHAEVCLRGCFDAQGVPSMETARARLLEAGQCHVILDLEELDYISSAGIGSIMALFQALRRENGAMVLLRPSRRVMDLLNLLGFVRLFPIAETRDAAHELLAAARQT